MGAVLRRRLLVGGASQVLRIVDGYQRSSECSAEALEERPARRDRLLVIGGL